MWSCRGAASLWKHGPRGLTGDGGQGWQLWARGGSRPLPNSWAPHLLPRPPLRPGPVLAAGAPQAVSGPACGWWFICLTTVARLGICLTEFSTSSSVTSTSVQFSSSDGNGSAPCLVTQGCSFNE